MLGNGQGKPHNNAQQGDIQGKAGLQRGETRANSFNIAFAVAADVMLLASSRLDSGKIISCSESLLSRRFRRACRPLQKTFSLKI